jgi:deazaflavin-dependent oxidoreductase (nitroreductase family)
MQRQHRRQWSKKRVAFLLGTLIGFCVSLRLITIVLWRKKDPTFMRQMARFNKRWINRATLTVAGRRGSPYALLRHSGRRSGKQYATPVTTAPAVDGFVIPLVYGEDSDWYRNLLAARGGILEWQGKSYIVDAPELINDEVALAAFPLLLRGQLARFGVTRFVIVKMEQAVEISPEKEAEPHILLRR